MKINLMLLPLLLAATLMGCDNDTEQKAADAVHNANETMKDAAHEANEKMKDAADDVKEKAGDAADAVQGQVEKARLEREKQEAEDALKKAEELKK
ncbi:hypothetical protein HMY34_00265 [Thiothrix subterranea]|uniref:hypothetical protein n=1 Tax=Thiothrix subterranea TaxID=2735563 RepID=UPI00192BE58E|nr:hypothetical protein [Thiothrix subterranea]QQZ27314.1 hypothetical protein HMY34_00265 [Thiothrix subterranea]